MLIRSKIYVCGMVWRSAGQEGIGERKERVQLYLSSEWGLGETSEREISIYIYIYLYLNIYIYIDCWYHQTPTHHGVCPWVISMHPFRRSVFFLWSSQPGSDTNRILLETILLLCPRQHFYYVFIHFVYTTFLETKTSLVLFSLRTWKAIPWRRLEVGDDDYSDEVGQKDIVVMKEDVKVAERNKKKSDYKVTEKERKQKEKEKYTHMHTHSSCSVWIEHHAHHHSMVETSPCVMNLLHLVRCISHPSLDGDISIMNSLSFSLSLLSHQHLHWDH